MPRNLKGLKLSIKEVSQTFNLDEIFGVSFNRKPELRERIAQAFIDKIIERTESGVDVSGNDFKPYSKQYIESDDFKDFGKSPDEINMTLTGSMLDSIDIKDQTSNTVTIGFNGKTENAKAYNHNTGDTVKQRQFFGLTQVEINEIKRQFKDEINSIKKKAKENLTQDQIEKRSVLDFLNSGTQRQRFDQIFGDLFNGETQE